ncbi:MAG: rod shape-determining protein [Patescibacteria group bacterium]|nr:rod shape-determining protein [Patescibacteria group bacterium]
MLELFFGRLSHDIGIDLGTCNTLVYVRGKGVVVNEPSVVAINLKTKDILAIGNEAKKMVGKTPAHIVAIRPLVDGVISDYETTEQMLTYFIKRVHRKTFSLLPRPRVVIGIPYGVTEVERRAVEEAAINAGAREVYLIEEPMAAAIGSRLAVQQAEGSMIVDIGGGTTEVAVISMGGIVASRSLRIAGDEMNQDIIDYARDKMNLLIGDRTAEEAKIAIGSAVAVNKNEEMIIRGRDMITGMPKEQIITSDQVREAIAKSLFAIVSAVKATIEETPPELVADIMKRGIVLAGGGAMLKGLDVLLQKATETKFVIADDPMGGVVRGCGIVLESLKELKEVLLPSEIR